MFYLFLDADVLSPMIMDSDWRRGILTKCAFYKKTKVLLELITKKGFFFTVISIRCLSIPFYPLKYIKSKKKPWLDLFNQSAIIVVFR